MQFPRLLLLSMVLCATAASAQWQWLDKDGRKVYSDRAPPADIPDKNVLQQPGNRSKAMAVAIAPSASAASAAKAGIKLADVDKELADKKKAADDAEGARVKAVEERIATIKQDNCNRAKQAKVQLDTPIRLTRVNEKGEKEMLDTAARDAEARRIQSIIASDCG